MKILINLISGQTAPNFFAVEILKPEKVINVYTNDSLNQMKWFNNALDDTVHIEGMKVSPYNYTDIYSAAEKIVNENGFDELFLNFTAGTKIMSVAFFEVFQKYGLPSVYVDSENKTMIEIRNRFCNTGDFNVSFSLDKYFKLYGNEVKFKSDGDISPDENSRREYEKFLSEKFREVESILHKISFMKEYQKKEWLGRDNVLVDNLKNNLNSINFRISESVFDIHLEKKNKFSKDFTFQGGNPIKILNYISTGWYESYIYNYLVESGCFSDVARNIEITYKDDRLMKKAKNEIDIAAITGNTLYIIEIKTGSVNQDSLNKLRSLKDYIGGRYSIPVLVSFFPIQNDVLERAKDYGIRTYCNKQLKDFVSHIKQGRKNINLF